MGKTYRIEIRKHEPSVHEQFMDIINTEYPETIQYLDDIMQALEDILALKQNVRFVKSYYEDIFVVGCTSRHNKSVVDLFETIALVYLEGGFISAGITYLPV